MLGLTIGDVSKMVVGGLIALGFGWMNSKTPHLTVTVFDLTTFTGKDNHFGIFNFEVKNDGSKEAEEIESVVNLKDGTIKEIQVTPDSLNAETDFDPGKDSDKQIKGLKIKTARLNPKERVQVSLLLVGTTGRPDVTTRAKGINGETQAGNTQHFWSNIFLGAVFGLVFGLNWGKHLAEVKATPKSA